MDTLQPTGPSAELMTSSDGGRQWTPVSSTNGMPLAQTHFFDPGDAVAVAGSFECLESTSAVDFSADGGASWARASLPAPFAPNATTSVCPGVPVVGASGDVMAVAAVGRNSTHLGFLTSVDSGRSWRLTAMAPPTYTGSGARGTSAFHSSPPGVFGGVAGDGTWWAVGPLPSGGAAVSVSTDDGANWSTSVVVDLPTHIKKLVPIDMTRAWITGQSGPDSVIYQTDDGGRTWTHLSLVS